MLEVKVKIEGDKSNIIQNSSYSRAGRSNWSLKPEMEEFYIRFERCYSKIRKISLKHRI